MNWKAAVSVIFQLQQAMLILPLQIPRDKWEGNKFFCLSLDLGSFCYTYSQSLTSNLQMDKSDLSGSRISALEKMDEDGNFPVIRKNLFKSFPKGLSCSLSALFAGLKGLFSLLVGLLFGNNTLSEHSQPSMSNHPAHFPKASFQTTQRWYSAWGCIYPSIFAESGKIYEFPRATNEKMNRIEICTKSSSFCEWICSQLFGQNLARDSMSIFSRR